MFARIRGFQIGFDKTVITPSRPVYLAGLRGARLSEGVHDDLYVRTMALSDGKISIAFVGLDSIGLMYNYIEPIQEEFLKEDTYIIIGSSHCHSTPDLIGIWGPSNDVSGVDEEYLDFVLDKIKASIRKARENMEKSELIVGYSTIPNGVARNGRDPGLIDRDISLIFSYSLVKREIRGFLVNFGLHPEVLWSDNKLITADYVYYLLKRLEKEIGGIGVFLNGSLGGMITPDIKAHTFEEAKRVGFTIADSIISSFNNKDIQYDVYGSLNIACKNILLPVENEKLILASMKGVIKRGFYKEKMIRSQICSVKIGKIIHMVTFPGEPLPKVGLKAKKMLDGPFKFVIGLGNDEIGYIIDSEDWTPGKYEESMSLSSKTADLILSNINEICYFH